MQRCTTEHNQHVDATAARLTVTRWHDEHDIHTPFRTCALFLPTSAVVGLLDLPFQEAGTQLGADVSKGQLGANWDLPEDLDDAFAALPIGSNPSNFNTQVRIGYRHQAGSHWQFACRSPVHCGHSAGSKAAVNCAQLQRHALEVIGAGDDMQSP